MTGFLYDPVFSDSRRSATKPAMSFGATIGNEKSSGKNDQILPSSRAVSRHIAIAEIIRSADNRSGYFQFPDFLFHIIQDPEIA